METSAPSRFRAPVSSSPTPERTKSVPTAKVSLNWTPTASSYGFVARGFRRRHQQCPQRLRQYVKHYELGWRGEFSAAICARSWAATTCSTVA
jgi:hypothetical protein